MSNGDIYIIMWIMVVAVCVLGIGIINEIGGRKK